MSKRRGPNKANLEETRQAFIDAGTQEFVEFGYFNASTNRIVENAGMARGSLYYHFGDKEGLFRAVYEDCLKKGQLDIQKALTGIEDPLNMILKASHAYMDLCMDDVFRKITLVEATSVVTLKDRKELGEKTMSGILTNLMQKLRNDNVFSGEIIDSLYIFIYGSLIEIGRMIEVSDNPAELREKLGKSYDLMLQKIIA